MKSRSAHLLWAGPNSTVEPRESRWNPKLIAFERQSSATQAEARNNLSGGYLYLNLRLLDRSAKGCRSSTNGGVNIDSWHVH